MPEQLLDACAVLALLQDEPGADKVASLLPDAAISAVNLAEVLAKLISKGMTAAEAYDVVAALHIDEVVPFEMAEALASAKYVRPGISLRDRCFLATASVHHYTGWTSDQQLTFEGKIELFR